MAFKFVSNNVADFIGGAVSTTRSGSYRDSRVDGAIEGFTGGGLGTYAEHTHEAVSGDVTWAHAQFALIGSESDVPQNGDSDADGGIYCEAWDISDNHLFKIRALNGDLTLEVYGDTTVTDSLTGEIHGGQNDKTRKPIDVKVDLSGGDIRVQLYRSATGSGNSPILDVTAANTGGKTNPTTWRWRAYNIGAHNLRDVRMQISEVMVGDEDTRGLGLTNLFSYSAGSDSDWSGDESSLSDDDLETGMSVFSTGDLNSRAISGYTGPTGVVVRGVFLPANGQVVDTIGGIRAYLRNTTSMTKYDAGSSYSFGSTVGPGGLAEWATNPETGAAWDDSEFTDFEYGLEALA